MSEAWEMKKEAEVAKCGWAYMFHLTILPLNLEHRSCRSKGTTGNPLKTFNLST